MRRRMVWLSAALLIASLGAGSAQAQDAEGNFIVNGGFEDGATTGWNTYGGATMEVVTNLTGAAIPEGPIEGQYCLHVVVDSLGANFYAIGLQPSGIVFEAGKKYTTSVFLKCSEGTLQVNMKPELAQDPWTGFGSEVITMTDEWVEYSITTPVFAEDTSPAGFTFHIGYTVAEFWVDSMRFYEGDYVPPAFESNLSAKTPSPEDIEEDVTRDVVLSWEAGPFAATHDVYFGETFADVNDADGAGSPGVQVSMGQTGMTFDPEGLLEYGKTYFWRVDEVNIPSDPAVYRGNVWSFTVEPYVYPITNIIATASSSEKVTTGPENTINGSGLQDDLHSTESSDMWVTSTVGAQPSWIQYEFDKAYKLHEMWVWNYNNEYEYALGYGFQNVTVAYSLDGEEWTTLRDEQFAQATSEEGYAHNTTVDFGGLMAKYIRLTAKDNWSKVGLQQFGLSEVRIFQVPVQAREPMPVVNADGIALDATVSWRPGREADSHDVYFSTDLQAVIDGTAPAVTVDEARHAPTGLEYGRIYYWKVNEVNEVETPSVWEGEVWSFSTIESLLVEDFESYDDDMEAGTAIFQTWIDGLENGTGSVVGYFESQGGTFGERVVVHSGEQSMPLDYNNVIPPYYSETSREWAGPQDWTVNGASDLMVWVRGNPVSFAETDSGITMSASGTDIWGTADEFRYAYKTFNGDGVASAKVESIVNTNVWAKGGVMIRESLDPSSKFAYIVATPGSGVSFGWRTITNDTCGSINVSGINAPQYVKLNRTGNVFTAQYSADGTTWTDVTNADGTVTQTTISMSGSSLIGLAVTSHNASSTTVVEFSDVSTSGAGAWKVAEVGVAHPGNTAGDMYVTLVDATGQEATVVNPDPEAVLATAWTAWRIPLSDFTGVNTARIEKMVLGVGNPSSPAPNGAGRLYIDDIGIGRKGSVDPGPSGLVAYYALENDTLDSSGNGHDGITVGDPQYVDGPEGAGMALEFDGQGGQYVDLGTFSPSAETGQLSVSLWAKWKGLSGFYQGLIGKRDDSWAADNMMWQIEANQTPGEVRFQREGLDIASGVILPIGKWTHVLATFDGTIAKIFVDGEMVGEGSFSFGTDSEAAIQFGASVINGGNPFNGALDEIRLYNRALSAFEINYLAGK